MNSLVHGERSIDLANFRRLVKWTIGELEAEKQKDSINVE
jgi:hypothetical protein